MLYFAYGSNMDPDQMRERAPGARALGPARLPGHRLFFTHDSAGWAGGVASISPDASSDVWGVLWRIDDRDLAALDEYEGYPAAYTRTTVTVEIAGGRRDALVYVAMPTVGKRPSEVYLECIVRGAEAHGLPGEYVESLRKIPTA